MLISAVAMFELSIAKKTYESYVRAYEKEGMPEAVERYACAQKEREGFLDRFPVSRVRELSLEEYAFTKSSYGNEASFCSIMYGYSNRYQNKSD